MIYIFIQCQCHILSVTLCRCQTTSTTRLASPFYTSYNYWLGPWLDAVISEGHSTERSRLPTMVSYLLCSRCFLGFHRYSLDPLFYVLYTTELALVVRHGLNLQQHANDTKIFISTLTGNAEAAIRCLAACLVNIEAWLKACQLRLNPAETQQLAKVNISEVLVESLLVNIGDSRWPWHRHRHWADAVCTSGCCCSLFRMLLYVWCQVLDSFTISGRCCTTNPPYHVKACFCTGYVMDWLIACVWNVQLVQATVETCYCTYHVWHELDLQAMCFHNWYTDKVVDSL